MKILMKSKIRLLGSLILGSSILFSGCSEGEFDTSQTDIGNEAPDLTLESGYDSRVVVPLERPSDFEYYTTGKIEYSKDEKVIATLDYGKGEKDTWAQIDKNGEKKRFDLSARRKNSKYTKIVTKPLIKIEGCSYIVEGEIQYLKKDKLVATIDYGDGTCDEWAKKDADGESTTFSMRKIYKDSDTLKTYNDTDKDEYESKDEETDKDEYESKDADEYMAYEEGDEKEYEGTDLLETYKDAEKYADYKKYYKRKGRKKGRKWKAHKKHYDKIADKDEYEAKGEDTNEEGEDANEEGEDTNEEGEDANEEGEDTNEEGEETDKESEDTNEEDEDADDINNVATDK